MGGAGVAEADAGMRGWYTTADRSRPPLGMVMVDLPGAAPDTPDEHPEDGDADDLLGAATGGAADVAGPAAGLVAAGVTAVVEPGLAAGVEGGEHDAMSVAPTRVAGRPRSRRVFAILSSYTEPYVGLV